MALEKKLSDLLALLTAHTRGYALEVPTVPWPPTPAVSYIFAAAALEK